MRPLPGLEAKQVLVQPPPLRQAKVARLQCGEAERHTNWPARHLAVPCVQRVWARVIYEAGSLRSRPDLAGEHCRSGWSLALLRAGSNI